MKVNIRNLLYANAPFEYVAASYERGKATVKVGDKIQVNAKNIVPGRAASGTSSTLIGVGRVCIACELSPDFVLTGYDTDGNAYGTASVRGYSLNWKCDGKIITTTLPQYEEANLNFNDQVIIGLYPMVAWLEPKDIDMCDFRKKYQDGYNVTLFDVLRFNDAFYYSKQISREVDIIFGCSDSECTAKKKEKIKKKSSKTNTMLPWNGVNTETIKKDFSVGSAIQGKYLLRGDWNVVKEGNEEYDFSKDVIPLEFLEGYVDNPIFRSVLSQFVSYISSLFRVNELEDEEKNGPINQFLAYRNIKMKASNLQNVMLVGDPGTGKTMLMRAIAAALGLPIAIIRIGERDDRDVLTQEVSVTSAGFNTKHSQLYWYAKYGGIVVYDDITNADPNMLFSVIGGLLEAPYEYRVGDEIIKRNPLSLMSATANIGTTGSQTQNQALLTRFSTHEVVEKLSADDFKTCIWRRAFAASGYDPTAKEKAEIVDWTYKVFSKVRETVSDVDKEIADQLITLRSAIALCEMILDARAGDIYFNATEAACKTMGNILYSGGQANLRDAVCASIRGLPGLGK